jgi:hypothetical protein
MDRTMMCNLRNLVGWNNLARDTHKSLAPLDYQSPPVGFTLERSKIARCLETVAGSDKFKTGSLECTVK